VFVDYVMLPTKNANGTSTYDGWQNTGTGAALKLPNNHPISELYDGSDTKNGIETFVPYGVTEKHYDPIKFTLNIYLNGKKIVYQKNMIFLSLMEFHKYHQI
jgi:hypothetical protein